MSFEFIRKLPTPTEVKNELPVPKNVAALKTQRDKEIADVITGRSDKFLAIIGPCSADNEDAVLDYTLRLKKVQEKIADKVLIIPRVYTNKPRTTGTGYKGMLHQPDPEKKPDLLAGLIAIRKMHIRVMEETELMPADEMLYPLKTTGSFQMYCHMLQLVPVQLKISSTDLQPAEWMFLPV